VTERPDLRAYNRDYYARNRERIRAKRNENRSERLAAMREYRKGYHARLKGQVFEAYGNCCACCGEGNPGFLSVDHVNGGGRAHRKAAGSGTMVWLQIIKQGFPAEYQLLCFNCNLGRYFNGGTCPHKNFELTSSAA